MANSTYTSIMRGFQQKYQNISIVKVDPARIPAALPKNRYRIMFRIYNKETKTQRQCKACKNSYHRNHLNRDCPFNQNNIFYIFSQLGIKPDPANLNIYTRDFSRRIELPTYPQTFKEYHWEMNLDDYNKSECFIPLTPVLNRKKIKITKSREKQQLEHFKKVGLIKTPECMICCEDIPIEQIYFSEKCKCNYIYCNTCWHGLKEVREGVKQCPQCRVETTAPIQPTTRSVAL